MIIPVRTARPSLVLNGQDYYKQLAPYFLTMQVIDNCDGKKADDLHLQLADRDHRFITDWMPEKGAFIDVGIVCERWFSPSAAPISLDCGRFWIDEIEFVLPEQTLSIKANSIPTTAHLKSSNETRGWEDATLKQIAQQIAGENGMEVDWEANVDPKYKRIEQVEESGLCFLQKRAADAKLALKVCRNKLIFFDEQTLEAAPPKFAVVYGNAAGATGLPSYGMSGGQFVTMLVDTTKKAKVSHVNPDSGELKNGEFSAGDDDLESGSDQHVNENPDSEDEGGDSGGGGGGEGVLEGGGDGLAGDWNAQTSSSAASRRAKKHVRHANKHKKHSTLDLEIGNPLVAAGQVCQLKGVGKYDGNWFVESVTHKVGPMFTTKIGVRHCLTGY
jgi:phage protein D